MSYSNWNATTSTWRNVSKQEYFYAADSTTLLGQDNYYAWSNTCDTWKGTSSYRSETNSNGLTIYIATFSWSETYCSWIPQNRRSYTYNSSGNTLSEYIYDNSALTGTNTYTWDSALGTWTLSTGNETSTYTDSHGDSYIKTTVSTTYNSDGSVATYELTTNYYNTEN